VAVADPGHCQTANHPRECDGLRETLVWRL